MRDVTASSGPIPRLYGTNASLATSSPDLWDVGSTGFADVSLDLGERRHVREEPENPEEPDPTKWLELEWKLSWANGRLEVELKGRPDDRPYQVMIVVEETIYSGQTLPSNLPDILSNPQLLETLHTPFVAELANQVIFVAEAFFDKERRALERGEKMWDVVVNKYALSAPIGPGDPIVPVIDEVRDMVSRSPSTSTLAAGLEARMDFARRTRPDLLDEVMRQADADASARSAA